MKRHVYDCCEGACVGLDSSLPTMDEIIEFSAHKGGRKRLLLVLQISSFHLCKGS